MTGGCGKCTTLVKVVVVVVVLVVVGVVSAEAVPTKLGLAGEEGAGEGGFGFEDSFPDKRTKRERL